MKAFHKVAAALATLPVAGVIALTGAGIASAATCPAGQHWNEMGGGSGFCSPNASGGGTGGNGSVDLGGTNTPAPQTPVFNQPAPYKPPVYGPAPVPVYSKPDPVQQAPIRQAPAPVQNYAPVAPVERSVPASAEVHGSTGNEVKSVAPGTAVSEPKKEAANVHKEVAADKAPEKAEVKKDADKKNEVKDIEPSAAASTDSASPTPSATPTPVMAIDASRSSETQKVTVLSTFIAAFATLASFVAFLIIRNFRNRKPALIESDENS